MTEAVLALTKSQWNLLLEQFRKVGAVVREHAPTQEIVILGSILAILQIMDGILTAQGVHHFGIHAEGNPLLRWLMLSLGYETALIVAKVLSLVIIAALCFLATRVQWLIHAIRLVIFVYLGAAIIPWSVILLKQVYLS
ncbi:MAG: hypothetical protein KDD64_09995 [Bdellovibrionales bacterium]|nr:hypothetical protein [Bdellovibrionales bacterium]